MRRKNDDQLTDDEVQFLRSDKTPNEIRRFLARQHDTLGVRTNAYQKVARAARAERNAMIEVRLLEIERLAAGEGPTAGDALEQMRRERDSALGQIEAMREEMMKLTAIPALAVDSESTR